MSAVPDIKPPRLENWRLRFLAGGPRLYGNAFGHPSDDVSEGEYVITSEVQRIDFAAGTAETRNTRYQLGERAAD